MTIYQFNYGWRVNRHHYKSTSKLCRKHCFSLPIVVWSETAHQQRQQKRQLSALCVEAYETLSNLFQRMRSVFMFVAAACVLFLISKIF